MTLLVDRQVTALDAPPTQNTQGFNVSGFAAALITVGQFNDIISPTITNYGLTDDEAVDSNGQPTGASTFPDGVQWPLMADFTQTKTSSSTLLVPLEGIERWRPGIGEWAVTGGAPSLQLKARLLTQASVTRIGNLSTLAGLSDVQINRIFVLGLDDGCAVDLFSGSIINAEVANVIRFELHARDEPNVPLAELIRFDIELFDSDMIRHDPLAFTANIVAPGVAFTNADQSRQMGRTDTVGDAFIDITDVVGGSGELVWIIITPLNRNGVSFFTFVIFD